MRLVSSFLYFTHYHLKSIFPSIMPLYFCEQTVDWMKGNIQIIFIFYLKQKRKLRLYISNTFNPAKPDAEDSEGSIASWELRVEGKLLDDVS